MALPVVPVMTSIGPAPENGDPDGFTPDADNLLGDIPNMIVEFGTSADGIDSLLIAASASSASAGDFYASVLASSAQQPATGTAAALAARATAVVAAVNPNGPGVPTRIVDGIRRALVTDGKTVSWGSANQFGDIKIGAASPGALYLPLDGSIRNAANYPLAYLRYANSAFNSSFTNAFTVQVVQALGNILASASDRNGNVVILLSNGTVGLSTDFGVTWAYTTVFPGSISVGGIATDGNGTWIATAGADYAPVVSRDLGKTWQATAFVTSAGNPATFISADSSGTFVVTAGHLVSSTLIQTSNDGGKTVSSVTRTSVFYGRAAGDGKGVWLMSTGSGTLRSLDYGITWNLTPVTSPLSWGMATDGKGTWVTGSYQTNTGNWYTSPDNGVTWLSKSVTIGQVNDITYSDGFFYAARNAGGANAGVMVTPSSSDAAGVTPVYPTHPAAGTSGPNQAIAIGAGIVLFSTNLSSTLIRSSRTLSYDSTTQFRLPTLVTPEGLKAWVKVALRQSWGIRNSSFVERSSSLGTPNFTSSASDDNGVIIALRNSAVLRSTDGGSNWTTITTPVNANWITIAAKGDGNWIISASDATTIRSTDNGLTWTQVNTTIQAGQAIYKLVYGRNNRVYALGNPSAGNGFGNLSRSTDNGATWATVGGTSIYSNVATNGLGFWFFAGVLGTTGPCFVSTNDGDNISAMTNMGAQGYTAFPNGDICVIPGTRIIKSLRSSLPGLVTSLDGGVTWTTESTSVPAGCNKISINSAGVGMAGSTSGAQLAVTIDYGKTFQVEAGSSTISLAGQQTPAENNPWVIVRQDRLVRTYTSPIYV